MHSASLVVCVLCAVFTCRVSAQPFNDTLYDFLIDRGNTTHFLSHSARVGLNLTFKDPYESLTVVAPSDKAFEQLPADVQKKLDDDLDFLTEVLTFHLYQGAVSFTSNNALYSSLMGATARVNVYTTDKKTTVTTIQGVPVSTSESITARNGYLSIIDEVLYPIPTGSALNFVSSNDDFSKFHLALTKAGMTSLLSGQDVTILAPNNAAINSLPDGLFSELLADIPVLTVVLRNHIVQGVWYSAYFKANGGGVLNTMEGRLNVKLSDEGAVLEMGLSNVTQVDVSVTNGVIYVINHVLLPPNVAEKLRKPRMRVV